jgi:heterodisulfide reductase subunit A-like polyferredoxin
MNTADDQDTKKPVGAVMVIGAGIGGIQAALDLAESGFRVYLVEEEPAIGGIMAQLDKTFPTNDCSMCIISPKLVEVGRHLNIDILSYAEVEKLEGTAGNFTVHIKQKPRFVDLEKCTGCGDCAKVCPVEIANEFDAGLINRKAIYKRYPQAIPNAFAIDKRGTSPCKDACPAGIHVQGYVALIAQRKFKEALSLIRKHNPLPAICGRICTHPCETACTRNKVDDPINIMCLKRFVTDWEYGQEESEMPTVKEPRDEKIAVVGSGPAGLSAAFYLALEGYKVTVFEALPEPGGMLRWGIPDYRLPGEILNKDISYIQKLGVKIKTNTVIGPGLSIDDLFKEGFKSVFLSVGAQKSMRLKIEGEDLQGVVHGVDYLRAINGGEDFPLGDRVAVIGGGNVAIDVVRSALRKGSKEAFIIYRRSCEEMPALDEEIKEAEEEGVKINYLMAPQRIIGRDGKVSGIECIRMELREPDESGRRRPVPIKGSHTTITVDSVVPAIGQSIDLSFLPKEQNWTISRHGSLLVDPVTFATSVPGVFAGGDMVTGPATVVEAVGAGREAAISISRFLNGICLADGRGRKLPVAELEPEEIKKQPRQNPLKVAIPERIHGFQEVQQALTEKEAVTEAQRCLDCGICSECLQCVDACLAKAIYHDMQEDHTALKVGSIILAPGFSLTDPNLREEYGYKQYQNVVTSLEFERILSASGPYQGHIKRPSDESGPARIAWIQCVGSRDTSFNKGYCSSVCCMYATKEAIIAKEHASDIQPTIFYMDIRAHGKGFDAYYERARDDYGVRYIRCQVSKIVERPKSKNLMITYINEKNEVVEEEFDLVVLSLGLSPSSNARMLADKLNIALDHYGFCRTDTLSPTATSHPGIYVCGAFESPKDIPETVTQASGASAAASEILAAARGTLIRTEEFPPERDITKEDPKIGVFVCHCGINIGGVVDVPAVKEYARSLPGVAYVDENLYTCSQDTQAKMKAIIQENGLNRVVVASCSPRTHEPLFQTTIREAGLNKYLFEMANIRDQCSWVHMDKKEEATEKAKDLLRMAVAAAGFVMPLQEQTLSVNKKALVIGGGAAGMAAALGLADQGFEVFLVEKEKRLGGNLHKLYFTIDGTDIQGYMHSQIERVRAHPAIQVILDGIIVDATGFKGNFKTGIMSGPGMAYRQIEHGITIIATGGEEYKPKEYLYGEDERVLTQQELEEKLAHNKFDVRSTKDVVMIQCVGSRIDERPYCSRLCCSAAIKNALKIKAIDPETNIYIIYRDIRTYGLLEDYYTLARKAGIIFIRYDLHNMPEVAIERGALKISVYDPSLGEPVIIHPQLLVLSSAIIPRENGELATLIKLQRTQEGFFLEAHMKLRPVDFATEGIFLCGLAHSPKPLTECLSQASAAVSRACTLLSHDTITAGGMVAVVEKEKCAVCLTCVRVCPYDVPFINEDSVAQIDAARCQGCGTCAAECPGKAIQLQHATDRQILAKTAALFGA